MNPTEQDLKDAACWFDVDKAGGPEMTAFRREARWRQHRWAVDALSITQFGTHAGRGSHPDMPREEVCNGTKLVDTDAEAGSNFLTPAIFDIATTRVAAKQEHETLDQARLFRDLLSSMPMAFNLFGEASMPVNEASRLRLARMFGLEASAPSDIVFEWSPARRSNSYTRDRTAFDIALRLGESTGPRTVVGIETKYHERAAKEPKPAKAEARRRRKAQTEFLEALADSSGVFRGGWQDKVLDTPLRQIWRDHLLALSMRQHPDQWTEFTRYALLYPSRNVSFRDAAAEYQELLVGGDTSFLALAIDDVVDAAFAHGGAAKDLFRRRYLWWAKDG